MKQGRDNFARLYELLTLINALRNSRSGLSYDDLQLTFPEWKRRTTERMMGIIKNHYRFSLDERRGPDNKIYFRLKEKDQFPPNCISEDEIVALKTAIGFVKNNEQLKLPLENLAGKLEAMKNDSASGCNIEDLTLANGTASAPRPHIKYDRKIIETLQEGILAYRMAKIKYRPSNGKAASWRLVCPLGFLYGVHHNYLIACYADKDETPRHYILSRVLDAKLTSDQFDAEEFDIHKYAQKSFGVWISPEGGHKVKWKVSPKAAERAEQFVFHPTQKITRVKDGGLVVEFFADGLKEMAWHLMTWEGMIKPVAPVELVEEYRKQVELAAKVLL